MKVKPVILAAVFLLGMVPDSSAKINTRIAQQRRLRMQRERQVQQARAAAKEKAAESAATNQNATPLNANPGSSQNPGSGMPLPNLVPPARPGTPRIQRNAALSATSQKPAKTQTTSTNTAVIESHYNTTDQVLEFQRANAAKGNADSQYVMGMRYLSGIGVPRDRGLAREFLEKSAAQGNAKAREQLREITSP